VANKDMIGIAGMPHTCGLPLFLRRQLLMQGTEFGDGAADPIHQGRAIELDPLAGES
jgi:hypothetical protein